MIGTNSRRRALLVGYGKKGPEESRVALRTPLGCLLGGRPQIDFGGSF